MKDEGRAKAAQSRVQARCKPGNWEGIGRCKPGTCMVHAWYMRGTSLEQTCVKPKQSDLQAGELGGVENRGQFPFPAVNRSLPSQASASSQPPFLPLVGQVRPNWACSTQPMVRFVRMRR